ncbi:HK97-gp10 family putative phage morphogenesis protein [Psychrobacter arenosus]|uniref:HK97-gp10 family putative phage morphogenesis protein n=1 Tax=Psychrobacter arenosus TaxID=256326 RepID=UPI0019186C9E|nr:HK97-gp10 family putative phage morphogenesis protein [Psychrobacter arenosus]
MVGEIEGVDEIMLKFRELGSPRKSKNAAVRSSRRAMNIVKKEAVARAKALDDKDSTERIWKNIVVKAARTRSPGFVVMRVGVKGGSRQYAKTKRNKKKGLAGQTYNVAGDKTNPGGDTWYWRLVELGTSHTAPNPFLRPALYNNMDVVQEAFGESFNTELDKEIAKL